MDSFKKFWDDASTKLKGAMDDNEKLDALLSDAKGKKVNFRNTILILTSNVGADLIKRETTLGFGVKRDEKVSEEDAYLLIRQRDEAQKKLQDKLREISDDQRDVFNPRKK